jgi:hypothetical protein
VELESYETASKEEVWVMKIKEKLKWLRKIKHEN